MFVCVHFVYSYVVWFSCIHLFVFTWCFLWTKLYIRKHKICGTLMLSTNVTILVEQIHIFKTKAIAELSL